MSNEEFEEMYTDYLENCESAPDKVRNAYSALQDAFDEYLDVLNEYLVRSAFQYILNRPDGTEMRKVV